MKTKQVLMLITLAAVSATGWAQIPSPNGPIGAMPPMRQGGGGMPPMPFGKQFDPMKEDFYPPEFIMQNQQALSLTDEQRSAIKEAKQKSIAKFTDMMWQQSAEQETMESMLKQERLDEAKILAQLDKLLSIEDDMKRTLLGMLLKVKNNLSPVQITKLRSIKQYMMLPRQDGQFGPDAKRGHGQYEKRGGPNPPPEPTPATTSTTKDSNSDMTDGASSAR